jgi:hypothetical protein
MMFHHCEAHRIGLRCRADFVLAFYVVHETPSPYRFFSEVKGMLKPDGRLLVVEPKFHVDRVMFAEMLKDAARAGLKTVDLPRKKGGRSVLFSV